MTDEIPKDIRGEYVSSIICQKIRELVISIRDGKSANASEDLINVFYQIMHKCVVNKSLWKTSLCESACRVILRYFSSFG